MLVLYAMGLFIMFVLGALTMYFHNENKINDLSWYHAVLDQRLQKIHFLRTRLYEALRSLNKFRALVDVDTNTIDRLTITIDILRRQLTKANDRLQREGSITSPYKLHTDVPEMYKGYTEKYDGARIKNLTIPIEGEIRILENPCLDIELREYYMDKTDNLLGVSECNLPKHRRRI